ncbi:MAG: hypothetical protein ABIO16_17940 [Nocardioides sp.]
MSESWNVKAPRVRVVRPVHADPSGVDGPTPGQARGPRWRRTSTGLVVPVSVTDDLVEQRIVEQGVRLRRGAITGWAALRLLGGGYFDGLARDRRTRLRSRWPPTVTGSVRQGWLTYVGSGSRRARS